jgi:predicted DNA binding CopG/RHH family protein
MNRDYDENGVRDSEESQKEYEFKDKEMKFKQEIEKQKLEFERLKHSDDVRLKEKQIEAQKQRAKSSTTKSK